MKIPQKLAIKFTTAGVLLMSLITPVAANAQALPSVANSVCGGSFLTINAANQTCPNSDTSNSTINNIIREVINIFSVLVGFISVVMIIFGGFKYITSGGDGNKIATAKNSIVYALIGLVLVVVAQILVRIVVSKGRATIV